MAPPNDYTIPGAGGGRLKLKGVQSGRIEKKKKRKKPKEKDSNHDEEPEPNQLEKPEDPENPVKAGKTRNQSQAGSDVDPDDNLPMDAPKTDAERRYEEARKKRLNERLKREGVKTHKERVEELNKYLSNLSEHHDMPRIGPG
ncbi:hypothetical protein LOZ12_000408 [Ophidiomyces ophidiicola]|uniref:Uncharacterized protein n=1 Tax=Ophidiomyces ophidiicola TaxID=1387563 RepID=A0ACB8UWK4_9EURO|nr:uncharacterized protein LOZ57_002557 [Ophidiomyces ophidiicola]KAI1907476.1 hypothetical protein LOZ61_006111 [Ophidiomyces ophidiicola]KAI1919555.1 hypothetical protein LOZ64_002252 [Ophidiomyces ophidiicola]KAI1923540.1 hypothetical protein LOZ60_005144 [Ophidiomyces ophidiicola]KAI1949187.1 hypothetical protein LOZ57_002557 [Ophidiomyces ophidiicola]KAI1955264.1 hypothetical protein LOZ62_000390 [Ophidiomyces ophidiicola]